MAEASTSGEKCQEESVISMVDVLEEEIQYEADARAVLGGSDPNQCTYEHGYLPRQALYACATCIKPDMDSAGICLACSLECHDGHDLYELYTKRNFRCDCGNSKFSEKCKLVPERDNVNNRNSYNQNFKGAYCTCARPYPDPEDEIDDEMIQCIVCEDWYHGRHTGCDSIPEEYDEFVCENCCKKCTFLYTYATLYPKQNGLKKTEITSSDEKSEVSVEDVEETKSMPEASEKQKEQEEGKAESRTEEKARCAEETPALTPLLENKTKETSIPLNGNTETQLEKKGDGEGNAECLLRNLKTPEADSHNAGGRFWPEGWRSKLCACEICKNMYTSLDVSYLCEKTDTITEYEARGKTANMDSYAKGIEALQTIDRTQQVEVLTEYASMKDQLTEYLKKFAESGKVVREEDIKEFFEGLKANKRQRTGLQYFCR